MGSVKIKCKESFGSFGSFKEDYPHQLTGIIDPVEFTNIIRTINLSSKSSFNKLYYLFLLGPLAAIALFIVGGLKFKKIHDEQIAFENDPFSVYYTSSRYSPYSIRDSQYSSGGSQYSSSGSQYSSSGYQYSKGASNGYPTSDYNTNNLEGQLSPTDADSYKPGLPWFYFVVGAGLLILGCCFLGCAYWAFKRKVLGKIEDAIIPINQRYAQRQIKFELITEIILKRIPDFEFNTHRSNQAYMSQVKYDSQGNPCKEEEEHYLVIYFSQNSGALGQIEQQQNQFQLNMQMQQQYQPQPPPFYNQQQQYQPQPPPPIGFDNQASFQANNGHSNANVQIEMESFI